METTIPSYLLAEPSRDVVAGVRQEITRAWWRRDHARFAVSISEGVLEEAEQGDRRAAKKRLEFLSSFPVLDVTPEVLRVTKLYIQRRIVPLEKPWDAAHWLLQKFLDISLIYVMISC